MRKRTIFALLFVCAVAAALIFLPLPVQSQQNCPSFRILIQAELLVPELLLREGDAWGGYIHGYLGQEPLHGRWSGNNGNIVNHAHVGLGHDGSELFDFGGGNTLTTVSAHSTFPNPPGLLPLGAGGLYQSAGKISGGTGRFQNASGNVFESGPWVAWDLDKELPQGRFNGQVTGNICGVE